MKLKEHKICRHSFFENIDEGYKAHLPWNKDWESIFNSYRECRECKVWKGNREDSHLYDKNYYQGCNIIYNGIPQRSWYFDIQKDVWSDMGVSVKPKRALELGCSVGRILWSLHRKMGSECVGIESSKWAYDFQKETYGFNSRYRVINADCEQVNLSRLGPFNFICALHVLEHLQNPMSMIEKCFEVLLDEGCVYFVVPDKEHQLLLHTHDWVFDKEVLAKWLNQAGFREIKIVERKPYNPPAPPHMDFKGHYLHVLGRK